jgi:hypothetical protein
MPKSVKLKLTLSDSTIVESNTFTIPDGPAGTNGLEPLVYKVLTLIGNDPVVGKGLNLDVSDFNRTPIVGEYLQISGYTYSKAKTYLISGHISGKVDENSYTFRYDEFVDITGKTGAAGKDGTTISTCEVVEV